MQRNALKKKKKFAETGNFTIGEKLKGTVLHSSKQTCWKVEISSGDEELIDAIIPSSSILKIVFDWIALTTSAGRSLIRWRAKRDAA